MRSQLVYDLVMSSPFCFQGSICVPAVVKSACIRDYSDNDGLDSKQINPLVSELEAIYRD